MRLLSTLFKELEKRGHKVVAESRDNQRFSVILGGEEVEVTLSKRFRMVDELTSGTRVSVQRPTDELIL